MNLAPHARARVAGAFAASLAVAVAPSAAAADAAAAEALDRITITARRAQPAQSATAAVARIEADAVRATAATHPAELSARIPGTWISRGSAQESLVAIRSPVLTGAGACGSFLMLEDGVPIRPAGFCNVNQMFELDTVQNAVEVLRGPGSVVHGPDALHGVINVVPRAPEASPRRAFGIEVGPDDYERALATFADGDGAIGWRADLYGVSAGSFRDDESYDQQRLGLQATFDDAPGAPRLLFSAHNLNQETAGYVRGLDAYRDARRTRNENPEAFRDTHAARLQARWTFAFDAGELLLTPYARTDAMRFRQHFLPGKPIEDSGSDSAGAQLVWRAGDWQAGVDVEAARGELLEIQDQPVDGDPEDVATRPLGRHYDYAVDVATVGAFAQREWALAPRWSLDAGARAQWLEYDYDNRMSAGNLREDGTPCGFGGCLFERPADRSDGFDGVGAQLGLRFEASDSVTAFGRLARAFRFPQATELYRLQRGQAVADFAPEVLEGAELGVRRAGARWRGELAGYAYRKRDVIVRDAEGVMVSDARTRHRGLEASGEVSLGAGWWIAGNVAYSIQRYAFDRDLGGGEAIASGNAIDTAPRWLGGLRLGYDGDTLGDVELELVHVGRYWLDAANTARYPGHDLLHLRWWRDLGERWRIGARLMNLTDRRYAERADYAFGNHRYFPGAGRGVFLTLEHRLE